MFEAVKLFLDEEIDRRAFIRRLTVAGVSLMGANTIANSLAETGGKDTVMPVRPEAGRILENLTGGEAMCEFLKDWEIPYIFGIAGSEEVGFLDALVDRPELHYMTSLHEGAAMAMADGYSRSTGATSVVQLHSVAGVAYALGQLVGSYRDRIPVVVTAGRQSTNFRGHGGFLESPGLEDLPKDYTQWTWDVMHAGTITEVLRRAFLLAEAPPGGPAFVTFSKDLWETRIGSTGIIPRSRSRVSSEVVPLEQDITRIVDRLVAARRPCLFLGNECIRHEISDEIAAIAETIGAMVMLSVKIPVVFPNNHPNFVGEVMVEDSSLLRQIDCFWSVGGHMFKFFNLPNTPVFSPDTLIMHTSMVETDIGRNYPVDVATVSSIGSTTQLVLQELRKRRLDSSAIRDRQNKLARYTGKMRKAFQDNAKKEWNDKPIATSRLAVELDRVMDPGAYVVSELISSDSYPRQYMTFDYHQPPAQRRRNFYTTSGVLGWGVAAAIGAKIGNPGKEVWCLTGDGCLNFGSQALWSAARYEVPIAVVIFNNGEYAANRHAQNTYRGRIYETGKYVGVNLGHPDIDYVHMAAAYGIEGERVTDPDQLTAALTRCRNAVHGGRPYLVDVRIAKYAHGKDSDWYDSYSVIRGRARS
jgi:benzoylformate decarboxylase